MKNSELKKLQSLELLLANEVKRLCEKNNINYFLIAGSMLGAVRHKGFIPWDDDMDIGLLREDYDKFLAICNTDLKDIFYLQTWDTDPTYPYPYAKLRLKGTIVEDKMTKNVNTQKSIFIDIFPFDKISENENEQKKVFRKLNYYKKILWIKKGYGIDILKDGFIQNIKYWLARFVASFYNYDRTKDRVSSIQKQYSKIHSGKVFFLTVYDYKKSVYDISIFESLENYEFESEVFKGPENYDKYLKVIYNDYMTLPPESKRNCHEISYIDFGTY